MKVHKAKNNHRTFCIEDQRFMICLKHFFNVNIPAFVED